MKKITKNRSLQSLFPRSTRRRPGIERRRVLRQISESASALRASPDFSGPERFGPASADFSRFQRPGAVWAGSGRFQRPRSGLGRLRKISTPRSGLGWLRQISAARSGLDRLRQISVPRSVWAGFGRFQRVQTASAAFADLRGLHRGQSGRISTYSISSTGLPPGEEVEISR